MPAVEIVAVGNELLMGEVQDTNTPWLCEQITRWGGRVERAVLLRDDRRVIARELRAAIRRKPALIFTIGGMGATADDLTLAAVALATKRALYPDMLALGLLRERFEALAAAGALASAEISEARRKMAIIPQGATPLLNPAGTAPAVVLTVATITLICCPGVPSELRAIVRGPLELALRRVFGARVFDEQVITVDCNDESALAPLLSAVAERHPDVYVKSHAERFGSHVRFLVTLSTTQESAEATEAELDHTLEDLRHTLALSGMGLAPWARVPRLLEICAEQRPAPA
ncbi:MAG: competence/damage-inducible protein A [Chloroflexi bacterium]|nr:competence/damage-inducible protein A [Chloroflexota bacterium]